MERNTENLEVYLYETKHKDGRITRSPHAGQLEIINSPARYKVVVCGRRWGKTMMAINILIEKALKERGTYWYTAPTYRQAKMIAWRFLMSRLELFPEWYRKQCKVNESLLSITFGNGSVLELKGVDNPDSLVGVGLDYVVLDEYAMDHYARSPVWYEIIRPTLADNNGGAMFISTPRGYNHLYDLYEKADSGTDPEWKAWRMPTSTNPYISRKELNQARSDQGEDGFSQEFMAEFRVASGLVYKDFSRDIHVIPPMDPNIVSPKWWMEVGVDFGSTHPTAGAFILFDDIHDIATIVDEYYQSERTIQYNAQQMIAIENSWMKTIRVRWGDSAGKQEMIEYATNGYSLSPTIKGADSVSKGIDSVKKRLRTDPLIGKPKLFVCSNCVNTIREFENYRYKDSGSELRKAKDEPEKIFDDLMDAVRYVISHHEVWLANRNAHIKQKERGNRYKARNPITGI